jgi:DNA-binding SARP family transcriptional activator
MSECHHVAPAALWVGVLGPLTIRYGSDTLLVRSGRQRAVLAVLAANANKTVTADRIAELVWDGRRPASEWRTVLRNHVMRLRRTDPGLGRRIVTRPSGYAIELGAGELDLLELESLYRQTAAACTGRRWDQAIGSLTAALGLWRGEPFADVPSLSLLEQQLPRLEQQHGQLLEWQFEAGLGVGRHAEMISDLRAAVAQYPLREKLRAHLMLALHRSGRRAEALTEYQHARRHLIDELGVEPGAELQRLQRDILVEAAPVSAARPPVVPRQLPGVPHFFVGRQAELRQLDALAAGQATGTSAGARVAVLTGMGGIGKTTLAVNWAQRAAGRFPDGQLFVSLRGHDPFAPPLDPAAALRGVLTALSVPAARLPADLDHQCALFRSLVLGKRMLMVVDDARSAEDVRPLLPSSPGCMVLVTSRSQLHGLLVTVGAEAIPLGLLEPAAACSLIEQVIGAHRVAAERDAIRQLAGLCGGIPLTICTAATAVAADPASSVTAMLGYLASIPDELDRFETGDAATNARSVIGSSYRYLDPADARMFRLLGGHAGPFITASAAAQLAGLAEATARQILVRLVRHSLLSPARDGRFVMHRIVGAYAAEQARQAALARPAQAARARPGEHADDEKLVPRPCSRSFPVVASRRRARERGAGQ